MKPTLEQLPTARGPRPALEPLLTVEQIAEWLAFQPSTIRSYCEQRKLPHVRIGGQLRFRPSEIALWLEQRSSRPRTTLRSNAAQAST